MESAVKPVQGARGRRGRWPMETKLAALQEWRAGVPGNRGDDGAPVAWVDRALQPPGTAQRLGNACTGRVLRRIVRQNSKLPVQI